MAKTIVNPRKKKMEAIETKLAMFLMQETYTEEPEVQKLIDEVIQKLDEAVILMVANDEKAAAEALVKASANPA